MTIDYHKLGAIKVPNSHLSECTDDVNTNEYFTDKYCLD